LRIFISGGCKNGKSGRAEQLALALHVEKTAGLRQDTSPKTANPHQDTSPETARPHQEASPVTACQGQEALPETTHPYQDIPLYYVATMVPSNQEDEDRISRHRLNRAGLGFQTVEAKQDIHLLLDSLNHEGVILLDSLTALLLNEMLGKGETIDHDAPAKVIRDLLLLAEAFRSIVFVSDYIYSDAYLYNELTSSYRRGLALIDRQMAALCDCVIESFYGNYITHKGQAALQTLEGLQ
jgi:adenosylcobinamide kinase/adenosylcobinamide-phosphate guanylyltransferase